MHKDTSRAFGVSLDELMGEYGDSSGIPRVIKDAIEYIRSSGMYYLFYDSKAIIILAL